MAPQETVIVGDSAVDVLTGRNAGTWTCGVTYGFAPHTLRDSSAGRGGGQATRAGGTVRLIAGHRILRPLVNAVLAFIS